MLGSVLLFTFDRTAPASSQKIMMSAGNSHAQSRTGKVRWVTTSSIFVKMLVSGTSRLAWPRSGSMEARRYVVHFVKEAPYTRYCAGMFSSLWGLYFAFFYIEYIPTSNQCNTITTKALLSMTLPTDSAPTPRVPNSSPNGLIHPPPCTPRSLPLTIPSGITLQPSPHQ